MSNRFSVPDDSPPSTPDRSSHRGSDLFRFDDDHPSTTPAGPPPPSSAASFTPAGAPSDSFLGSSMMRGVTAQKPSRTSSHNSTRNLFAPKTNSPLGRSVHGRNSRQPSRLSRQVTVDDDEDEEEEDEEDGEDEEEDEDEEEEQDDTYDLRNRLARGANPFDLDRENVDGSDEDASQDEPEDMTGTFDEDGTADLWLNMGQEAPAGGLMAADGSDLLMFATPAVDARIQREAEDIFRASTVRSAGRPPREYRFAPVAKAMYEQMGYATVTEAPEVIIQTEAAVSRLYQDGVGPDDDPERLDTNLAAASANLVSLWQAYTDSLPSSEEEHDAGIGPGPHASPFELASYVASLALQIHHTRISDGVENTTEPLTETLFRWLAQSHNLYPGQVQDVLRHQPAPACHSMFWQTVFVSLLRGRVQDAIDLLNTGGYEHIRRGSHYAYEDRALQNVEEAVQATSNMLDSCPGKHGNWEVWGNSWNHFRIRAKQSLDKLRHFAEGRHLNETEHGDTSRGRHSLTGLARKAESQLPWDIYENLSIIFEVVLGSQDRILAISQDWCEGTIALFGWWDESIAAQNLHMSRSRSLMLPPQSMSVDSYLDRLARAFHAASDAGLEINSNSPLEVCLASVFEDNAKGVVGMLRSWSLTVGSAVAEIASLGGWLPPHQPSGILGMTDLDMDDLEVLGVDPGSPDEVDGIKDNTLVQYAQALVNYPPLLADSGNARKKDGWEIAMSVLGRMDSPERSEETVGELVKTILENVDVDSGSTVERVGQLLNDLGMVAFAEETAEHYGDVLARDSHRYGEAMWYYALAHRPNKVREVMNLLISYSLIQSTSYPHDHDLDEHLRKLLRDRNASLELLAKQDLEAAELLGRMLSGYATLRKFYDIRDNETMPLTRRRAAAAAALTAVIASADDNIRGGLYDKTRDAVVCEDFLLALLGEALVFVDHSDTTPTITLQSIDVLLKAIEDIQTVGSRVYTACDEFFQLVLKSATGLKGSTPADLMRKSSSGGVGGSFVMSGSTMLASQLHRSISASSTSPPRNVVRGWDWRTASNTGMNAHTTAAEALQKLRLGVSRDLAKLWLMEADAGSVY